MVWSIFGSAVHKVLEHGQDENHIVEERLSVEIDGWKVSGAIDLQIKGDNFIEIRDYKTVSAWSVMNEKIEWEYQLNLYAYLVERVKNVPVASLGIVAIIRDWSRREAARNPDYPQAPIREIPIPLWPFSSREVFIKARIHAHAACEFELETDGNLPFCTSQEMWEKPTVWAVKKLGGARAKSVHSTHQEALEALAKAGRDYEIEVRPGSRTRCESFCPVSNYCQQWRDYQESMK
jgi:RecB family exonuclease